eukprot:6469532-Amphidinium_carterae.1
MRQKGQRGSNMVSTASAAILHHDWYCLFVYTKYTVLSIKCSLSMAMPLQGWLRELRDSTRWLSLANELIDVMPIHLLFREYDARQLPCQVKRSMYSCNLQCLCKKRDMSSDIVHTDIAVGGIHDEPRASTQEAARSSTLRVALYLSLATGMFAVVDTKIVFPAPTLPCARHRTSYQNSSPFEDSVLRLKLHFRVSISSYSLRQA